MVLQSKTLATYFYTGCYCNFVSSHSNITEVSSIKHISCSMLHLRVEQENLEFCSSSFSCWFSAWSLSNSCHRVSYSSISWLCLQLRSSFSPREWCVLFGLNIEKYAKDQQMWNQGSHKQFISSFLKQKYNHTWTGIHAASLFWTIKRGGLILWGGQLHFISLPFPVVP